tara:strand:+ start:428 stop:2230 length:1803 start_codon:yes stop_codon:yes gene_type:complete
MSTYQGLKGLKIKYLSANTSDDRAKEGEVFYNSTSGKVASHIAVAAVSSGTPMTTGRNAMGTTTSTGSSAFAAGGNPNDTEHYNGNGWSEGTAINTDRRYLAGCGTLTAGLIFGGNKAPLPTKAGDTEEYDGSSWTESGDLNTARQFMSRAGTQTAALAAGGTAGPGQVNNSEEYNGTSWTEGDNLNTTRSYFSGCGTQTAGLCVAGATPGGNSALVEEYDGTSWSEQGNVNTARQIVAAAGPQTAAVSAGGKISSTVLSTAIEEYDGSAHSTNPATLTTGRNAAGGSGDSSNMVIFGGGSQPGQTTHTEEFNTSIFTRTAGAWSSGGALPSGAQELFGSGIQTAALCGGGEGVTANPPNAAEDNVFEYDGSSWTAGGSIPVRSNKCSGCGTQTATIIGGKGTDPYSGASGATRSYDGSSWTAEPSLGTARYNTGLAGTTTAAVAAYGRFPPAPFTASVKTEEWDGSSWTAVNDANNSGLIAEVCGGSQTAAIYAAINPGAKTELYDGTNWTNITPTVGAVSSTGSGTQTDFIMAKGSGAFRYNGTVWATSPDISTARGNAANSNVAATALISGGDETSTATEEFTDEVLSSTAKTIDFD